MYSGIRYNKNISLQFYGFRAEGQAKGVGEEHNIIII